MAQAEPTPLTSPCPVVLPTNSRIVGGSLIESPYMVAFLTSTSGCSGTLITPTDILTARHCDISTTATALVSSTTGNDGTIIPIRSVAKHPDADIMLVTLARPANVRPVRLLANPDLPSAWSFLRAQGYGVQSGLPFPSDRRQRFVDFPLIPADVCEGISQFVLTPGTGGGPITQLPTFPDDFVCTGYLQSASCTFCSGDSGGGVFSLLNDDPVLVGVISIGDPLCARPGSAGYSVRVSSYTDWLGEQGVGFDAVTELSETFVDSGGVIAPASDGRPRVPQVVVQNVQAGLATGAIAGIAVGGAALLLAVLLLVFFVRRSKRGGNDPPDDGGENVPTPAVATGSSLVPPSQSGEVQQPNNLPPPAPMYDNVHGKHVELLQSNHHPPQVSHPPSPTETAPYPNLLPAQQTTPAVHPAPTAPQPSSPPKQRTMPTAYPMSTEYSPTAHPPTTYPPTAYPPTAYPPTAYPPTAYPPPAHPMPTAPPPPSQTELAEDPLPAAQLPTHPPTHQPQSGP